ncbi:MAG: helix-turn-helix transcriptional regulator [Gammaproteobacteria bacterium]
MTDLKRLHKKWSGKAEYRKAYDELNDEFAIAQAMIDARKRAGLTQTQIAKRIKTTQSVIARLESGSSLPSTRTLQRYARATGSRLAISFEPINVR